MENKIIYPCIYALSAGMGFGPISIPEEYHISEKVAIEYVLVLMKSYIRGRAIIRWDEKGIKKPTFLGRKENGEPYH